MKVRAYLGMSLDGYIAGDNDDLTWLDEYQEIQDIQEAYNNFSKEIDCYLMGSRTYEKVLGFGEWPYSKKVIVLTTKNRRSLHGEEFYSGSLKTLLQKLELQGIQNIYADGGKVVSSLIEERLLDELTITLIPQILGGGISLFSHKGVRNHLTLQETRVFSKGLVQLQYRL